MKKHTIVTCLIALAIGAPLEAAITFNFQGGNQTGEDGFIISITDLTSGTPTDSATLSDGTTVLEGSNNYDASSFTATGTLTGVNNTDTIMMTVDTYVTSSLLGNVLTTSTAGTLTKNSSNGWGINPGSGGDITEDDALVFSFDLSGLAAGTGLRITDVNAENNFAAGVQVVVDGKSVTDLGGLDASGLNIEFTDGDRVAFRLTDTSGSGGDYRLRSMTMETFTIPEPSAVVLGALGGLMILFRRRRR